MTDMERLARIVAGCVDRCTEEMGDVVNGGGKYGPPPGELVREGARALLDLRVLDEGAADDRVVAFQAMAIAVGETCGTATIGEATALD